MSKQNTHMKRTALVSALMLEISMGLHAATIDVDGVSCNLNDAVEAANTNTLVGGCAAGSGDDVIELPSNVTLDLSATLSIESNVTINGNGSTIQPDPNLPGFPLVTMSSNPSLISVAINDLTLQNGSAAEVGGIIVQDNAYLSLTASTVRNITGGGIYLGGNGGVLNQVTVENTGNSTALLHGAAVSVVGATAGIINSTIAGNHNTSQSTGGAIWTSDATGSMAFFIGNSTISGNTAANDGGGISHSDYGNYTNISMQHTTIVNNSSGDVGGGISLGGADVVNIEKSLISGNTASGLGSQIHVSTGGLNLNNYNVIGQFGNAGIEGAAAGASDIVPNGAVLGVTIKPDLADNGGPTLTHALLPGGDAVDAIPSASCFSSQDQTGRPRPIDGDNDGTADCDAGAFEYSDVIFLDGFDQ